MKMTWLLSISKCAFNEILYSHATIISSNYVAICIRWIVHANAYSINWIWYKFSQFHKRLSVKSFHKKCIETQQREKRKINIFFKMHAPLHTNICLAIGERILSWQYFHFNLAFAIYSDIRGCTRCRANNSFLYGSRGKLCQQTPFVIFAACIGFTFWILAKCHACTKRHSSRCFGLNFKLWNVRYDIAIKMDRSTENLFG